MKFLVIGLGSIGTRHAKNLVDMGHTVFSYDIATYSEEPEIKPARLGDEVDAWVICTPTIDHMTYLIEATNRKRHIFVEKPIAEASHATLDEVLRDAKRDNLVVMVGNMLRFARCVIFARKIITSGRIGSPVWASFTVAQASTRYKDHVVLNWLSHECDLALYLLGPAVLKSCIGTETIADMVLKHESGAQSTIHGDYLTHPSRRFFTVQGTSGYLDCNIEIDMATAYKSDGTLLERMRLESLGRWPDYWYVDEMKEFIRLIDGGKPEFGATGDDGLATLRLLNDAINASTSKTSVHI